MAKGIPLMGRDPDGKAKIINVDENGNVKVQQSGTIAAETMWETPEIFAEAYQNILQTVGVGNVRVMLPLWETDGVFRDLVNSTVEYEPNGVARGEIGPFGPCISKGEWENPVQLPIIKQEDTDGGEIVMNHPGDALAVKLPRGLPSCRIRLAMLNLKRVGSAPNARLSIHLHEDNGGEPGIEIGRDITNTANAEWDRREILMPFNYVSTTSAYRGLNFTGSFGIDGEKNYWIVLKYADGTGINENNYLSWSYAASGANWGNGSSARAIWDTSLETWTVVEGEPFTIRLYDDSVGLGPGDWTIIAGAQLVTGNFTTNRFIFGLASYSSVASCAMGINPANQLRTPINLEHPNGDVDRSLYSMNSHQSSGDYNLYALTFSKEKNVDKIKMYVNGRKTSSRSGAGNTSQERTVSPWRIGASNTETGSARDRWRGKVGPFMVFNRELKESEIAYIYTQLKNIGNLKEAKNNVGS